MKQSLFGQETIEEEQRCLGQKDPDDLEIVASWYHWILDNISSTSLGADKFFTATRQSFKCFKFLKIELDYIQNMF